MNLCSAAKYVNNDMLYDKYDFLASTVIFYSGDINNITGTLRITSWKIEEIPEDIIEQYSLDINALKKLNRVGEFGFFIVKDEFRHTLLNLYLLCSIYSYDNNQFTANDAMLAYCMPGLLKHYLNLGVYCYKDILIFDEDGANIPTCFPVYDLKHHLKNKSIYYFLAKNCVDKAENKISVSQIISPISLYASYDQLMKYQDNIKTKTQLDDYKFIISALKNIIIISVKSNKPIIKKAILDYDIYFLVEGKLGVFLNENKIAELTPGDLFGELGLLDEKHVRQADITAVEDSKILVIPRSLLLQLEKHNKDNAIKLLHILCNSLSRKLKRSNELWVINKNNILAGKQSDPVANYFYDVKFYLATNADNKSLEHFMETVPLGGSYQFHNLYKEGFLNSTRIYGNNVQNIVGTTTGEIIFTVLRAERFSYVNGKCVATGYFGNLRLSPQHRGKGVIRNAKIFLNKLEKENPQYIYLGLIRDSNKNAMAMAMTKKHISILSNEISFGKILLGIVYLKQKLPEEKHTILRCNPSNLSLVIDKLNENRMQFAFAYTKEDFMSGAYSDYDISNIYLLYKNDRLTGVMGVYDQSKLLETSVEKYPLLLNLARPLLNKMRKIPLPPPKTPIKKISIIFTACDTPDDYNILFRKIYNNLIEANHYQYLLVSLHERDPRLNIIKRYSVDFISYELFCGNYETKLPYLDDRIPYIEAPFII